jgi:glyoxylate/hydroxypyruvate reductase A
MPLTVLFAADPADWDDYRPELVAAFSEAGLDAELTNRCDDPGRVDYIVYSPGGTVEDFTPFTRTKAVLNLWAGVERVVGNRTLTQPLARMVDPAMTDSMVEYVTANVLRHHLGLDAYIGGVPGDWSGNVAKTPLAPDRVVTILGIGELGQAVARALMPFGFRLRGWGRTPREVPGVATFHGDAGLDQALARADIVVVLLPHTPETENTLDARRLALMAPGGFVINAGRGASIDDHALLAALDAGQIGHATLDVFRVEPLPVAHPFWHHPRVTVTPHVAARTRPASSARVIAENIRRSEAGLPLRNLVDRRRGY